MSSLLCCTTPNTKHGKSTIAEYSLEGKKIRTLYQTNSSKIIGFDVISDSDLLVVEPECFYIYDHARKVTVHSWDAHFPEYSVTFKNLGHSSVLITKVPQRPSSLLQLSSSYEIEAKVKLDMQVFVFYGNKMLLGINSENELVAYNLLNHKKMFSTAPHRFGDVVVHKNSIFASSNTDNVVFELDAIKLYDHFKEEKNTKQMRLLHFGPFLIHQFSDMECPQRLAVDPLSEQLWISCVKAGGAFFYMVKSIKDKNPTKSSSLIEIPYDIYRTVFHLVPGYCICFKYGHLYGTKNEILIFSGKKKEWTGRMLVEHNQILKKVEALENDLIMLALEGATVLMVDEQANIVTKLELGEKGKYSLKVRACSPKRVELLTDILLQYALGRKAGLFSDLKIQFH